MKTYLPLARGAQVANYAPEQLRVLCEGGRLDCRRVAEEWFVAEEDLVETLAALGPELVAREVDEIAARQYRARQLAVTTGTGLALNRALSIVLTMFLALFGLWGLGEYLTTPAGGQLLVSLRAAPSTFAANLKAAAPASPSPRPELLATAGQALTATTKPWLAAAAWLDDTFATVPENWPLLEARLNRNLDALLGR
jgi:hypothetical protein